MTDERLREIASLMVQNLVHYPNTIGRARPLSHLDYDVSFVVKTFRKVLEEEKKFNDNS